MSTRSEGRSPAPDMGDMQYMTYALSSIFDLMMWIDKGYLGDRIPKPDLETARHELAIAGQLIVEDFKRRF
jgi:hypothetical protein